MTTCTRCHKTKNEVCFKKFKNGNIKQTCIVCSIKRKSNRTTEEKQIMNKIKIHKELKIPMIEKEKRKLKIKKINKELKKKFSKQRRREYAKEHSKTHKPKGNIFCPVQKRGKRSCQHCKRPNEFKTEIKTMEQHKKLLEQIEPNRKIQKPTYYFWNSTKYN